MEFAETKPLVRIVEPVPIEYGGQKLILLRDPQRITDITLTVSFPAYWVISQMDGQNTVQQIRDAYNGTFKTSLPVSEVEKLVSMLDKSFFLENDNFRKHRESVIKTFFDSDTRPAVLAGQSYPKDDKELNAELDSYLSQFKPNGRIPYAIVAPHIDLKAGSRSFGAAFSNLKDSKAETFLILGIGHSLGGDFFACIDKDFETPLGRSAIDMEFQGELEKNFGEPIYNDAFAHKFEHSIEFQVLFLQKLFGGDSSRKIVPILFSFPDEIDGLDHPKFHLARVQAFSSALKKTVEKMGDRLCIVAGIDLGHIGKRFGQPEGATKERLELLEKEDRELLSFVAEVNKPEFHKLVKNINPKNNICGFPALYILLDLLQGKKGELLDYGQSVEGNNDSAVSFAAMAFHHES